MTKKTFLLLLILGWGIIGEVSAKGMADYAKSFEIDMDVELPSYEELQDFTLTQESDYDTHYGSVWDLGTVFDKLFYARIATYGSSEKRLKGESEEEILEMLSSLPKEMYQYVGPMLFEIPNMSEKVLNLPGIKETKNKFPTRIAPQLQDVEDIEFLSPFLYFVLMPEIWPSDSQSLELPPIVRGHPKVVYNPQFYEAVKKMVPPENFMSNAKKPVQITRSDFRTIHPDKNSLLTSKDVQAFSRTLEKIEEFGQSEGRLTELNRVSIYLINYEQNQKDNNLPVVALKDLVNPCQRMVQKVKILGLEKEFALAVAGEGFDIKEWAYTCEKTMRAYRVSQISTPLLTAIKSYQNGSYDMEIDQLSPRNRATRYSTMQAILEMYTAPISDVIEVRKNRTELKNKFEKYGNKLLINPIVRMD